ncbi:MAG: type II toxin-antitoxin system MqsA family antitoxin [Gammaproteobacteria bacterium]|nr:type II toxin-antitoxin system MqsA family antitoxin [Gammaproteobacteria bacterium]
MTRRRHAAPTTPTGIDGTSPRGLLPYISPSASCAACGQAGVLLREVTRSFGRGPNLLVIEGIPMWSCPHCGESYFTAQTMHEIERIKALRKSVAVARPVPVAMLTDEVPDKALHRTHQKRRAGERDR